MVSDQWVTSCCWLHLVHCVSSLSPLRQNDEEWLPASYLKYEQIRHMFAKYYAVFVDFLTSQRLKMLPVHFSEHHRSIWPWHQLSTWPRFWSRQNGDTDELWLGHAGSLWVDYNDLTGLPHWKWCLIWDIIPIWSLFRSVTYCNLPRSLDESLDHTFRAGEVAPAIPMTAMQVFPTGILVAGRHVRLIICPGNISI